jgi:hypothetical protein
LAKRLGSSAEQRNGHEGAIADGFINPGDNDKDEATINSCALFENQLFKRNSCTVCRNVDKSGIAAPRRTSAVLPYWRFFPVGW